MKLTETLSNRKRFPRFACYSRLHICGAIWVLRRRRKAKRRTWNMSAISISPRSLGRVGPSISRSQPSSRLLAPTVYASNSHLQPLLQRQLSTTSPRAAQGPSLLGGPPSGSPLAPTSYFQRPSLPANTIIRFVPQQTAWIVERMGKFNRILQPGVAILYPILDRIAYVKSLKEAAIEIPSQSAITADNVTLDLDGVLYTRVFDAYKARYASTLIS